MEAPDLFGPFFQGEWRAWRAFLAAVFGLPMGRNLCAIYSQHTGRTTPPPGKVEEAWMVIGRGGGKSRIAGLIATYLACFCDWSPLLAPGQLALIAVTAADKDQARVVFTYILGLLEAVPALRGLVKGKPSSTHIEFHTGVRIEIRASSFKTIRGYSLVAAILDEIAYWETSEKSLNPDREVLNAMRPGLARIPGSILIGLSSPYARKGVLWDVFDKGFRQDTPTQLVWKATTREMNPTFPENAITKALADDEPKARAEYLAEFRSDLESYVSVDVVKAATMLGRHELPARLGITYHGFLDPSGGSQDDFTVAIGHTEMRDGQTIGIVDCLRHRTPPFQPTDVVAEFADVLKRYGVTMAHGDHYAGEWPREAFGKHGISYVIADQNKSELYLGFLPALNSGRVELLDHERCNRQLRLLERRTSRGGKDSVDHPPNEHDDLINAVAGCLAPLVGGVNDGLGFLHYLERQGAKREEAAAAAADMVPIPPPSPPGWPTVRRPAPLTREERLAGYEKLEAMQRRGRGWG